MIDLPQQELEILKVFNGHNVRYLITGGCAMQFWGMEDRIAEDIDIWIDTAEENATRVYVALVEAGIRPKFQVDALRQPNNQIRSWRTYLDIVTSLNGVDFESAYTNRATAIQDGQAIPIISPQDLLKIKRQASNEHKRTEKELKDIEFLQELLGRSTVNEEERKQ